MSYPELIGRTIQKYTLNDDHTVLTFETDAGPIRYRTEGDCCSWSWIESIDDPDALLGTVQAVEDVPMPDLGDGEAMPPSKYVMYPEYLQYYGLKITTEKGRAIIDYRNSSNGYYGGWLELVGER